MSITDPPVRTTEVTTTRKRARSLPGGGREGDRGWASSHARGAREIGLGRDLGPLSSRNSSKGALVAESHAVFRALASGLTIGEVRARCLGGRLLRQPAQETRQRIWEALQWRFFEWNPPAWILQDLMDASQTDLTSPRFVGIVFLHSVRRDRLAFGFVTEKLWSLRRNGVRDVDRSDVMDFLAENIDRQPAKWRESTRLKVAGNVLSALRDFGVLTGVRRKQLQRPVVSLEVALHLCRLLAAEGLRGRALLEARDWRLFLWDIQDTSHALSQLAQRGEIRFERSGRTVVLELPGRPPGGGR